MALGWKKGLIISLLSIVISVLGIWGLHQYNKNNINETETYYNRSNEPLASQLNHANTYFWYARTRKNTWPEFEHARSLAKAVLDSLNTAQNISKELKKKYEAQAKSLINVIDSIEPICQQRLSTKIPLYTEIMGYDELYKEEDCELEEVKFQGSLKAVDQILDLKASDQNVMIKERPNFGLILTHPKDKDVEELVVEKLNSETKIYTISEHELTQILGDSVIDLEAIITDTAKLSTICDFFHTQKLQFIHLTVNDSLDGLMYFGLRLDIWERAEKKVVDNVYVEYFTKNKLFNQMATFKIPNVLIFIILGLCIGICMFYGQAKRVSQQRTNFFIISISTFTGIIAHVLFIELGIPEIANPIPDDYYASDLVMVWQFTFAISFFVLPLFLSYIVIGKIDRQLIGFRSNLDQFSGIFSWIFGSLLTFPAVVYYYLPVRYGINAPWEQVAATTLYSTSIAVFIALNWSKVTNFPQKVDSILKFSVFGGIGIFILHYILYIFDFTTVAMDAPMLNDFFISQLPVLVGIELVLLGIERLRKRKFIPYQGKTNEIQPKGIENFEIIWEEEEGDLARYCVASKNDGSKNQVFWIQGKRGLNGNKLVEKYLLPAEVNHFIHINFSEKQAEGSELVHYYPFAKGFESVFSFKRFNDVSETAKKAGNLLGKILGSISEAVGNFLMDESEPKPRHLPELSQEIVKWLTDNPSVVVFDHINLIQQQEQDLLNAILSKTDQGTKSFPTVFVFCEYSSFSEKEAIIRTCQANLSMLPPFDVVFDQLAWDFVSKKELPIQAKLKLADTFIREKKDVSPETMEVIFQKMVDDGKIEEDPNSIFPKVEFHQLKKLPEVDYPFEIDEFLSKNEAVKRVLIAAAYASDSTGTFRVRMLEKFCNLDRIQLLFLLREAELNHIIYDKKSGENYDLFAFSDLEFVNGFKETENSSDDIISQLGKEYYRLYVEFFGPTEDVSGYLKSLKEDYYNGKISTDEIELLCHRSAKTFQEFSDLAWEINFWGAQLFSEHQISKFDAAKLCIEDCMLINQKAKNFDRAKEREVRALAQKFLIEVESNDPAKMESTFELLEKESNLKDQLPTEEYQQMLFNQVKACFILFKANHAKRGLEILEQLKTLNPSSFDFTRMDFYRLKLIPSNQTRVGHKDFNESTFEEFESSFLKLLKPVSENLSQYSPEWSIRKEILNDYYGSFLNDRVFGPLSSMQLVSNFSYSLLKNEEIRDLESLGTCILNGLLQRLELDMNLECNVFPNGLKKTDLFSPKFKDVLFDSNVVRDRRGICYTMNYLCRYFSYLKDFDSCRKIGILSFQINKLANDQKGCILSSSSIGRAIIDQKTNQKEELQLAFHWYEISFGFAYQVDDIYSEFVAWKSMMELVGIVSSIHKESSSIFNKKATYYQILMEAKHLIHHFSSHPKIKHFADRVLLEETEVSKRFKKNKSKFKNHFWADSIQLVQKIHQFFEPLTEEYVETLENQNISIGELKGLVAKVRKKNEYGLPKFELSIVIPEVQKSLFGENAVVPKNNFDETQIISTAHGQIVKVDELPFTNEFQIVMYFDAHLNNWRISTAFPGIYAPPYPNQYQNESDRINNTDFWANYIQLEKIVHGN